MKRTIQFTLAGLLLAGIVWAQSAPLTTSATGTVASTFFLDGGTISSSSFTSTAASGAAGITLPNGACIDFNGGSADAKLCRSATSTIKMTGSLVSATNGGTNIGAANLGFDYMFIFGFKDGNSVVRQSFSGDDQTNYLGQANDTTALTAHSFGSKAMTAGTDRDLIRVCNGANTCTTSTAKARITTNGTFWGFGVLHTRQTLPTCVAALEGDVVGDVAAGLSTGKRTKICLCSSDGGGTPAYVWQNVATGTLGSSTVCGTE